MIHRRHPHSLLESLESRRLFTATPLGSYSFGGKAPATFTDADGTVATLSLPNGQATLTIADDGWHVAISSAARSSTLTITTSNGGDGQLLLHDITSHSSLKSLNISKANLVGALSAHNVASITLGSAADLSLISNTPLTSLTANSWSDTDATPDSLSAPSITTLNIKGQFAPALNLTSTGLCLKSANIGGTITGDSTVAGSAKTIHLHAIRTPNLNIAGSITKLSLDDYVAITSVASATGGVLHLGGSGSVSAAGGKDQFKIAKNTTLYTCTAAMYSWEDLYQYTHLGRSWTYKDGNKTDVSTVSPNTQSIDGHTAYVLRDTGKDPGSTTFYLDDEQQGHILSISDGDGTFNFTDLTISPSVYQLGMVTHNTSKASGSDSEDGISVHFSGNATFSTHLIGHALVTTPAGTFLAVKVGSSLSGNFSGAVSNGHQSIPVKVSTTANAVEYAIPGLGVVKEDDTDIFNASAPSINQSSTDRSTGHQVLIKAPTDSN